MTHTRTPPPKRTLLALLATAGLLLALPFGAAAADYPDKPITLVVGFSPGSSIDMVARAVANKLSEKLGQTVIVDNKAGAGGNVAAGQIARSAPDGYQLLVVANSIAISPAVYPNLKLDVQKDLRAIAYVGIGPVILKVNSQRGFNTVADLVKFSKANPGALNFGSSGVGGTPHMATVLFDTIAGIKMTHIPYKGGSDALGALIGGQVDVLINPLLGDTGSDKVKSLAITGQARSSLAPGVPTFAESGYPGYGMGVYYGIMGPAGMPADVVRKLNTAVNQVLADPSVLDALSVRSGIALKPGTPEEFQQFINVDIERWKTIVKNDKTIIE
jgi:tripartite-type tricarboxylate transporter receptor subunit TctC